MSNIRPPKLGLSLIVAAALLLVPVAAAEYVSPTQQANRVLKLPQRTPCNVNLFARGVYPKSSRMTAAPGAPLSEAQVRAQLEPYLYEQFGTSRAQTNTVLSVFDRYETKRRIPQPVLRAAFVSMAGTLAEPALNFFLKNESLLGTIDYGTLPRGAIAQSVPDGSRRRIVVDSRLQHEHFGLLTAVLAREILHHDGVASPAEDAIASAVTALTHLQLLQVHPPLATRGTELSRTLNTVVLAWTNSRPVGSPTSAIVAPRGRGVYPGSPLRKADLWTLLGAKTRPAASPAPTALGDILRGIVAPGVAVPAVPTFGRGTALLFGRLNDRWLTALDRVRVSALLGLVSVPEITRATGLDRAEAVRMFGLGSIRPACR